MTRRSLWLWVGLVMFGCNPKSDNPEGAAKLFLRAVNNNETQKVFAMLAPADQQRLEKMAALATAQTGGRRRFKGEELLALRLDRARRRLSQVTTSTIQSDRAEVMLSDIGGKQQEKLRLVRVAGAWRVLLNEPRPLAAGPGKKPGPPPPATLPATRPATTQPAQGAGASQPATGGARGE